MAKQAKTKEGPYRPTGRPSSYTKEMGDLICEGIAEGEALHRLCAREGYPGERTVYQWLEKDEIFAQQYAYARARQQDRYADEVVTIAADKSIEVDRARVMIDARKWLASKLAPKKYGDRTQTEITGANGGPVKIETSVLDVSTLDVEELEALEKALTATIKK